MKIQKGLAIAAVVLQVPMLALWTMVASAVYAASCGITTNENGGFILALMPAKIGRSLLVHMPVILPLIACMVLSIWGLVRFLKGKHEAGRTTICLYGGVVAACVLIAIGFSQPMGVGPSGEYHNHLVLTEYSFFRYPFGLDPKYDSRRFSEIWPLVRLIKYLLLGALAGVSGTLCGLSVMEMRRR